MVAICHASIHNHHLPPTRVIHGACYGEFRVAGTTVGSIRASLVDAFNLPVQAISFVNGTQVDWRYRLRGGETLEFVHPWGRKGANLPVNEYGTIDTTGGIPAGCVHVEIPRIGVTCKRLGIEYAKALVGWNEFGGRRNRKRYPVFSGIIVQERDHATLLEAIAQNEAKQARKAKRLPVLAALFTLNRRAKRCRDMAQRYYQRRMHGFAGKMKREKDLIYGLKGQVLHHLVESGVLVGGRVHRFEFGNWAEVLVGGGYTFHRPCPPPQEDVGETEVLESIEAKPKGAKEPTLKIAYEAIERFLNGLERISVYQWPPAIRGRRSRWNDDDEVSYYDQDEYDEQDDE